MRKVCITNVFGPLNRGDFALLRRLVDIIWEQAQEPVELIAIARDPDLTARHFPGLEILSQPGTRPSDTHDLGWLIRNGLTTAWLWLATWLRLPIKCLPDIERSAAQAVGEADLVVCCPGGYLEDGTPSFLPQVAQVLLATRRGRRSILAPMSIGPVAKRWARWLLKAALDGADAIYVRESESESVCEALGLSTVKYSSDLVLAAEVSRRPPRPPGQTRDGTYLAATVVNYGFSHSSEPEAARANYLDVMISTLEQLAERLQVPVRLLLQVDSDRLVTAEVADRLTCTTEIVELSTPSDYRRVLAGAVGLVASRFHSALFGLTEGTPTTVISYLPKSRAIMADLGLSDLCTSIHDPKAEILAYGLLRQVRSESERERVRRSLAHAASSVRNPFITDMADWLGAADASMADPA